MLEYWMGGNESASNASEYEIQEVIADPASASLFAGYPSWLLYLAAGCCVLFMLIGIPGNLITVAALFRTKKLRNATAVFIMNLSVSDLMFCCFNLPLATSTFWHGAWLHGALLCRLFPLLRYGLVAVSLFTVLAITINRYVMIGHPRLYPKLYKPRYLLLMVLATWLGGFGALLATWFGRWGRFGLDPLVGSCSILPDHSGRSPKEFLFILAFLAPCLAIVVCYARIFYIVRRTALKSRRRDEATRDLVRAASEAAKCSKNLEDSAIGSMSGQPTQATSSDNGQSPLKCAVAQVPELRLGDESSSCPLARSLESLARESSASAARALDSRSLRNLSAADSRFLSAPAAFRYDEVSDDCASSRSDSLSERRRARRMRSLRARGPEGAGRMSLKDRKLLKMILVIFSSFLVCYLPITISKTFKGAVDWRGLNIAGYILIYLTTCINPVIYVVMSSEYRSAYKNVLLCRSESGGGGGAQRARRRQ